MDRNIKKQDWQCQVWSCQCRYCCDIFSNRQLYKCLCVKSERALDLRVSKYGHWECIIVQDLCECYGSFSANCELLSKSICASSNQTAIHVYLQCSRYIGLGF